MAAGGLVSPRLILFGDSITEGSFENGGWGAAIANRLVRKCDVLNRGLSGYNTRWALTVMPKIITQPPEQSTIAAVVIFFGANDSALKDVNPVQHIPLTEYAENLRHLIQYLKSIGNKLDRYNSVTKEYAQACVKVATECGTGVLDLWTLMQIGDFSSYLLDGLHLSEKGSRFLETHLWPMLEKRTENLPMIFPNWRDIDHLNCQASLLL
ncbi:isoamyl acetate-hydrolyzing esterase 1 homolog isoform X2 [Mobula birostris]|uniref:isoamyl acetate-hydrolyzing esterase 1 homolog isoform X2 n=1 Tax=Mobula birostris TaxID=1983395 RepID=UPI003B286187